MREKYESLSLAVLKDLAKARGMKGISTLRKPALIERMLEEDAKESDRGNPEEVHKSTPAENTVKEKIMNVVNTAKDAWQGLKDKITNNPIVATVKKVTESLTGAEDGNHAAGLQRVPYNNYLANLHQGEAILPRREADKWRKGQGNPSVMIAKIADTVVIREEADLDRFAEKFVRKLNEQKIIT